MATWSNEKKPNSHVATWPNEKSLVYMWQHGLMIKSQVDLWQHGSFFNNLSGAGNLTSDCRTHARLAGIGRQARCRQHLESKVRR